MQEIKKNMKIISIGNPGTGRSPWFNAAKEVTAEGREFFYQPSEL